MSPPKPTVETLDVRVEDLENWRDEVIKVLQTSGESLETLKTVVGSYPTDDDEGAGLARDLVTLKDSFGEEPSSLKGTPGSGAAKLLFEVHKSMTERHGFWPGVVMKVKGITVMLTFVVVASTVITGCAAAATYLIRLTVANTSVIAHKP